MAYVGKFVDRNPNIKTAGVSQIPTDGAGDSLRIFSTEEAAEALIVNKCRQHLQNKRKLSPRLPALPESNIKDIFSTELRKSRFVAFREKFSEDMYFKNPELGKAYQVHSKPDEVTNENTTFGEEVTWSESAYDVVFPKKTPDEVNREYRKWHDKYVLSHNAYYPSERINRNYDQRSFDPKSTFGRTNHVDNNGGNVKQCLHQCERLIVISKAQKSFLEASHGRLGKPSNRHNYYMPKDMTFGLTTKMDNCGVQALIENIDPCFKKTQLIDAISYIHKLRRSLFERLDFHIHDLKTALQLKDVNKTGYLTLSEILEVSRSLLIRMNPEKIRIAVQYFNLILDDCSKPECVNYEQFWKLLQVRSPLPRTNNFSTIPDNMYNKETTYRNLCKDLEKRETVSQATPTFKRRTNEEPTTAKDVIEPDIPMHFGLGQSDFEARRPKEQLRTIFKRVLNDNFDEVWERAIANVKPPNDLLSVNEIRAAINRNVKN